MWPFKRKLKILAFGDMKSGCWTARIKRPLVALWDQKHAVYLTNGNEPLPTEGWDIVLFNNLVGSPDRMDGDNLERKSSLFEMMDAFRDGGAKIVYDTDDAQDIIPEHPLNRKQADADVLSSFDIFLKNADLITTTTPTIAQYLRTKTDKPVEILPNCMKIEEFPERSRHTQLRIGMAGSISHIKDILLPLDAIKELQKKYNFQFFIFGFDKLPLKKIMRKCAGSETATAAKELLEKLEGIDYSWIPPVSAKEYPARLAELGFDIGICPLEDTPFNRNKSCIKFYEYSLVGTCAIASDVLPYSLEPVLKAKDWYADLEKLILDSEYRHQEAARQRDWVLANRDISKEYIQWEKAYKNLI